MVQVGKHNDLQIVRLTLQGAWLSAGDGAEILLPNRDLPATHASGDWLSVFVYADSRDTLVATTATPLVTAHEVAFLRCVAVNSTGAFLDWGLPKDLLVPFAEQRSPMRTGAAYPVYVYVDKHSQRLLASPRLSRFLSEEAGSYRAGQAVQLLLCERTELGFKAVIDGTHLGLLHHADVFQPIKCGQQLAGFIKQVRADQRIDLCLKLVNQQARDELESRILAYLEAQGGSSDLTDKSPPEAIYSEFGVSKKNYKKALGGLYKKRLITLAQDRVALSGN